MKRISGGPYTDIMTGGFPSRVNVASSQTCVFHKWVLFQRPTTDLYMARVIVCLGGMSGWRPSSTTFTSVNAPSTDCEEPFELSPVGTEHVVLRHVLLSNKGKIFPYTFQRLFLFRLSIVNTVGITMFWRHCCHQDTIRDFHTCQPTYTESQFRRPQLEHPQPFKTLVSNSNIHDTSVILTASGT